MIPYGKRVRVEYTGTFDDGEEFDSTDGKEPLEFELGSGMVIEGFDEAVRQMKPGEIKHIHVPVNQAYGEWTPDRVQETPMYQLMPFAKDLKPGKRFYFVPNDMGGMAFPAVITEIQDGIAKVDLNHPLAGRDLNFEIKLLEVLAD